MNWLSDPRTINYALLCFYGLLLVRWLVAGNWNQVLYWTGALMLNIAVIKGLK